MKTNRKPILFQSFSPMFLVFLYLINEPVKAQPYPQNDFINPVEIPILLAGSFGELRGNHFHSGLDYRTQGVVGHRILSVADGYVSRIKVSAKGYGNALYINHPNGYTSVYAHLDKFNEEIEEFVRKVQYQRKTFEIELFPNKRQFVFKQGDLIAFGGNSGSSSGPHLHFEIRDTKTEEPINPFLFGFKVEDDIPPKIRSIRVYPMSDETVIGVHYNQAGRPPLYAKGKPVTLRCYGRYGKYQLSGVSKIAASGPIAFSIQAFDYHNKSANTLGIYEISLKDTKSDHRFFYHRMERFSFAHTRYLNAHVDYAHKKRYGKWYQRSHVLPGNLLTFYEADKKPIGIIHPEKTDTFSLLYELTDYFENSSRLPIQVEHLENYPERLETTTTKASEAQAALAFDKKNYFEKGGIALAFPAFAFYDTVFFNFEVDTAFPRGFSHLYQVHQDDEPVQKYYDMSIKTHDLPEMLREKALIVQKYNNYRYSWGGEYAEGFVNARVRNFGNFYVDVDTVPPSITPVNVYANKRVKHQPNLKFVIKDNLSGIDTYDAYLNGKWILMKYDKKYNVIYHEWDKDWEEGTYEFLLKVKDKAGNENKLELKLRI